MRFRIYFPKDEQQAKRYTHIVVPLNAFTGYPFTSLAVYFRKDGSTFTYS
jgi:hypothetical protein